MTMTDSMTLVRRWYDKNVLVIIGVVLLVTMVSLMIGVVGVFTNARQDAQDAAENKARDAQTAELLECFDAYADANSESSKEVREASVAKDVATAARDDALNAEGVAFQRLVRHILTEKVTPEDVQALAETLDQRAAAAKRLDQAQAALDKARRENPVPPPPSEFCSVK